MNKFGSTLLLAFLAFLFSNAMLAQGSYIVATNKTTDKRILINTGVKIKYHLQNDPRKHRGHIQSVEQNSICIDGKSLPKKDILAIYSWGVKKKGIEKLGGILLTGTGVLLTAGGIGSMSESGEDGYSGLVKMAGVGMGLLGAGSIYLGIRSLKRKTFYVAQWDFESMVKN